MQSFLNAKTHELKVGTTMYKPRATLTARDEVGVYRTSKKTRENLRFRAHDRHLALWLYTTALRI